MGSGPSQKAPAVVRAIGRIIRGAMKLALWTAECKTLGCHGNHVAKVIGQHMDQTHYELPPGIPEWFDFQCPTCGNKHRYTTNDLKVTIVHFAPPPNAHDWW